jgi:hypothetical protein
LQFTLLLNARAALEGVKEADVLPRKGEIV